MKQSYTSGGQASRMERRQACRFSPLLLLLLFVCLSPVISTVPGVEDAQRSLWESVTRDDARGLLEACAHQGKVVNVQKALFEAVGRDDEAGIEAAVRFGADLEAKDGKQMTALALAAKEGRERAVSTLLRLGAKVESASGESGWTPLFWAMGNRQNQTEALLRKAGAKMSKEETQDLLWVGVLADDPLRIEGALSSGADLEGKREGWTPLTLASLEGKVEAVRTLLRRGARLEVKAGKYLGTALHWACHRGREAVVKLLLGARADVEAEEQEGYTPLHYASQHGHLPIVRLLVEAGANVNHKNRYGGTPLVYAEVLKESAVVDYLRSVGATT